MDTNENEVWGYPKVIPLKCPHCNNQVNAELIELRIFVRIYQCDYCNREIHKKTLVGTVFSFRGMFKDFF